jgi:cytochrome c-type biogenesis protein CcmH/NrfG
MSNISLRAYNRNIEELIGQGRIDESLAHCKHVLKIHPKHVGTYRLMGKAFLESQRYTDAADILQRVLSILPDDFVSHVGMSIIREDEGNQDAAIWHMERAFESQPSNSAIQDELRRLYGKRDGLEPPKVRLTRGALARMYAQGNLHQQAIAELRAALGEDPQRYDLQILLARMHYFNGDRVEAAETCSALLKKLPFCLEANSLLAEILRESERADEARAYAHAAQELDPYAAYLSADMISPDEVAEDQVTLPFLDWKPGQADEAQSQPSWAASLGVSLQDEQEGERIPSWLSEDDEEKTEEEQAEPEQDEAFEAAVEAEPEISEAEDELSRVPTTPAERISLGPDSEEPGEEIIPGWMKDAGWTEGSGEDGEFDTADLGDELFEETDEQELAPAEIPEWLSEIAPEEEEAESLDEDEMSGEILPWLESQPPGPTDSVVMWLEENKPDYEGEEAVEEQPQAEPEPAAEMADDETIPTWLQSLAGDITASDISQGEAQADVEGVEEPAPADLDSLPSWLKDLEPEDQEAAEPQLAGEAPDWVSSGEPEAPAEMDVEAEALGEILPEPSDEGLVQEPAYPDAVASDVPMDEDGALAWLESLAVQQGAEEEEMVTSPDDRQEAPPDWVTKSIGDFSEDEEASDVAAPLPEMPAVEGETPAQAGVDDWLKELESEAPETPESIGAEDLLEEALPEAALPDWLQAMEEEPQPAEEQAQPAAEAGDLPDWLSQITGSEPAAEEALPETPEQPVEELAAAEAAPATPPMDDQDAALAWLESLAAKQGAEEEELVTSPAARSDSPPEWVRDSIAEEPEASPAEPEAEEESVDAPDWMLETMISGAEFEDLDDEAMEGVHETLEPESTPDWLMETAISQRATMEADTMQPEDQIEQPEAVEEPGLEEEPVMDTVDSDAFWMMETELPSATGPPEDEAEVPKAAEELPPSQDTQPEDQPDWVLETLLPEPPDETMLETHIPGLDEEGEELAVEAQDQSEWMLETDLPESAPTEPLEPLKVGLVDEETAETLPPTSPEEIDEPVEEPELIAETPQEIAAEAEPMLAEDEPSTPEIVEEAAPPEVGEEEPALAEPPVEVVPEPAPEPEPEAAPEPAVWAAVEAPADLAEALSGAQEALEAGEKAAALQVYQELIKKGRKLDAVIEDLRQALYRFPVDTDLWECLGDTYNKADQLQEALDAYTKAEELLR